MARRARKRTRRRLWGNRGVACAAIASRHGIGCTLGIPFFTRCTCRRPSDSSICCHCRSQTSEARRPWRSEGRLHVHRVKNGIASVHPIRGDEMRALRKLRRAAGQSVLLASTASSSASARLSRCLSRSTHTCCAMPVVLSSPMMATTHGLCSTTSGTRTSRPPKTEL